MAIAVNQSNAIAHSECMQITINDEEFAQWIELLGRRIGLRDTVIRKSSLLQSLEKRVLKRGLVSSHAYFELLRAQKGNDEEWDHLIELLPLHETRFFRHGSSLNLVRNFVQERCANERARPTSITAWSVGCSTGEEVFSLAMVMQSAAQAYNPRPRINVTGSDLSRNSLNTGRRGVYHRRQLTNISAPMIEEYFDKVNDNTWSVKQALRALTQFVAVNLRTPDIGLGLVGPVDIVFCQNVLIYFDLAERERIVNQLAEHVLPGGILVLGAGELLRWNHAGFNRIADESVLAYKKPSALN